MARLTRLFLGAALAFLLGAPACGTDAAGTDACRKIEQARCRKAPSCAGFELQGEVGMQECMQFARDRCLHGFAVADPGPTVVDECVRTIDGDCAALAAPETFPACNFLKPIPVPEAGPDVAGDADAGDALDASAADGG